MKFYPSKLLNKHTDIISAFTTKKSGNLAFHVGDDTTDVINRHKKLACDMGYNMSKLIHMKQIHSNDVLCVEEGFDFEHPPTCDGLITDKKGIPLMVMVADCSPILLYDPIKKVIAVVHAGRAGAFKNIVATTLEKFKQTYNSKAEDILISIGPAICEACYEVGEEIYYEAKELELEYALTHQNARYHLNIRAILQKQLLNAGAKKQNIEISDLCSCCSEEFYSYRGEEQTGRFAGVIMLK